MQQKTALTTLKKNQYRRSYTILKHEKAVRKTLYPGGYLPLCFMSLRTNRHLRGRIWNCFVGGGDNADAYFLLHWSDNDGKTWSDTKFIIDPHRDDLPFKRRTIVGQLWTDPIGRLWLFMDQAMTYYDGRAGNWYAICENPDAKHPIWSEPKYLSFGCTLNKPTVMSTGEWVLPVSLWIRRMINVAMEKGWTESPLREAHHDRGSSGQRVPR